tara:strand:+ start:179 stop:778 length:600 start_codon:yes stop_codon:yes gene_type:complete
MTSSQNPYQRQIDNRNYMSPLGFKLILTKTPKVDFLCQSANIPGINMGTAVQPTYLKDIPVPGDKVLYDDLSIRFLVDEKMENYLALYRWITGLGYPESVGQFEQLKKDDFRTQPGSPPDADPRYFEFSDATLQILSSNYKPSIHVNFIDAFPVSLSTLEFDASIADYNYFTAQATFKYTIFNITDPSGNRLDNNPNKK